MHNYYSNKSSGFNILYELAIIRNSSTIGLIAIHVCWNILRFFNDKVLFQTFWSINVFSFQFCCESELPNNLADLAEAAFGQRYSQRNCWVLLSVRKHFANILVFTRLWRFLNTHLNVYLMIPVSVFPFTLKFLYLQSNTEKCSSALPSDRLTWKVLKLVLSANTPPPPTEAGEGKQANKYSRHCLGVEKGRRECWMWWEQIWTRVYKAVQGGAVGSAGAVWRWGRVHADPLLSTYSVKNEESLQVSAVTDSACRGWNLCWT